jgi:hypothetical protein
MLRLLVDISSSKTKQPLPSSFYLGRGGRGREGGGPGHGGSCEGRWKAGIVMMRLGIVRRCRREVLFVSGISRWVLELSSSCVEPGARRDVIWWDGPGNGFFPIYRICMWWSCERGLWLKKDKFFCRDVVFSYFTRTGGSPRFMHRAAQGNELRRSDSYLCCERWSVVATSPGQHDRYRRATRQDTLVQAQEHL